MVVKVIHANIIQIQSGDNASLRKGDIFSVAGEPSLANTFTSPLWLVDESWKAIAECSLMESSNVFNDVRCDYIYQLHEVEVMSQTLVRLFAGEVDPYIYLLAAKQDYVEATQKGCFTRDSLADEGFIHATPYSQIMRLANKYYKAVKEPHILKIDKERIKSVVKWEPAKGGLYPHIYGPLNSDAIVAIEPLRVNENGDFILS